MANKKQNINWESFLDDLNAIDLTQDEIKQLAQAFTLFNGIKSYDGSITGVGGLNKKHSASYSNMRDYFKQFISNVQQISKTNNAQNTQGREIASVNNFVKKYQNAFKSLWSDTKQYIQQDTNNPTGYYAQTQMSNKATSASSTDITDAISRQFQNRMKKAFESFTDREASRVVGQIVNDTASQIVTQSISGAGTNHSTFENSFKQSKEIGSGRDTTHYDSKSALNVSSRNAGQKNNPLHSSVVSKLQNINNAGGKFTFFDTETVGDMGSEGFSIIETAVTNEMGDLQTYYHQLSDAALKELRDNIETVRKGHGHTLTANQLRSIKRMAGYRLNADNKIESTFQNLEDMALTAGSVLLDEAEKNLDLFLANSKARNLATPNGQKGQSVTMHDWGKWYDNLFKNDARYAGRTRVAHNNIYDESGLALTGAMRGDTLDTLGSMARQMYNIGDIRNGRMLRGYTQSDLLDFFGLTRSGQAHFSGSDVMSGAEMFEEMRKDAAARGYLTKSTANRAIANGTRLVMTRNFIRNNPLDYLTDADGNIIEGNDKVASLLRNGNVIRYRGKGEKTLANGTKAQYTKWEDETSGMSYHHYGDDAEQSNFVQRYTRNYHNGEESTNLLQQIFQSGYGFDTLKSIFGDKPTLHRQRQLAQLKKITSNGATVKVGNTQFNFDDINSLYKQLVNLQSEGYSNYELNNILSQIAPDTTAAKYEDNPSEILKNVDARLTYVQGVDRARALSDILSNHPELFKKDFDINQAKGLIRKAAADGDEGALFNIEKNLLSNNINADVVKKYAKQANRTPVDVQTAIANGKNAHTPVATVKEGNQFTKVSDAAYQLYQKVGGPNSEMGRILTGEYLQDKYNYTSEEARQELSQQYVQPKEILGANGVTYHKFSAGSLGDSINAIASGALTKGYGVNFNANVSEEKGKKINRGMSMELFNPQNPNAKISLQLATVGKDGTMNYNGMKLANYGVRRWDATNGVTMQTAQEFALSQIKDFMLNDRSVTLDDGSTFDYNTFSNILAKDPGQAQRILSSIYRNALFDAAPVGGSAFNDEIADYAEAGDTAASRAYRGGMQHNATMFKDIIMSTAAGKKVRLSGDYSAVNIMMSNLAQYMSAVGTNPEGVATYMSNKDLDFLGDNKEQILRQIYNSVQAYGDRTQMVKEEAVGNFFETADTLWNTKGYGTGYTSTMGADRYSVGGAHEIGRVGTQRDVGTFALTEAAKDARKKALDKGVARTNTAQTKFAAENGISSIDSPEEYLYTTLGVSDEDIKTAFDNIASRNGDIGALARKIRDSGQLPSVNDDSAVYIGSKAGLKQFQTIDAKNKILTADDVKALFGAPNGIDLKAFDTNGVPVSMENLENLRTDEYLKLGGSDGIDAGKIGAFSNIIRNGKPIYTSGDTIKGIKRLSNGKYQMIGETVTDAGNGRMIFGSSTKGTIGNYGWFNEDPNLVDELNQALKEQLIELKGYGNGTASDAQFLVKEDGPEIKDARKPIPRMRDALTTIMDAINRKSGGNNTYKQLLESFKTIEYSRSDGTTGTYADLFEGDYLKNDFGENGEALANHILNTGVDSLTKFAVEKGLDYNPNVKAQTVKMTRYTDYFKTGNNAYKWGARSQLAFENLANLALGDNADAFLSTFSNTINSRVNEADIKRYELSKQALERTAGISDTTDDKMLKIISPDEYQKRINNGTANGYMSASVFGNVMDDSGEITEESLAVTNDKIKEAIKEGGYSGAYIKLSNPIVQTYQQYDGSIAQTPLDSLYYEYDPNNDSVFTDPEDITEYGKGFIKTLGAMETGDAAQIERAVKSTIARGSNDVFTKNGSLFQAVNNPRLPNSTWLTARGSNDGYKDARITMNAEQLEHVITGYNENTKSYGDVEDMQSNLRNLMYSAKNITDTKFSNLQGLGLTEEEMSWWQSIANGDIDDMVTNAITADKSGLMNQLKTYGRNLSNIANVSKYKNKAIGLNSILARMPIASGMGEYAAKVYGSTEILSGQAKVSNPLMKVMGGDFDGDTMRMLGFDSIQQFENYKAFKENAQNFEQLNELTNLITESAPESANKQTDAEAIIAKNSKAIKGAFNKDITAAAEIINKFSKKDLGLFSNRSYAVKQAMREKGGKNGFSTLINTLLGSLYQTPEEEAMVTKHAIEKLSEKDSLTESDAQLAQAAQHQWNAVDEIYATMDAMGNRGAVGGVRSLIASMQKAGFINQESGILSGKAAKMASAQLLGTQAYMLKRGKGNWLRQQFNELIGGEATDDQYNEFIEGLKKGEINSSLLTKAYDTVAKEFGGSQNFARAIKAKRYQVGGSEVTPGEAFSGLIRNVERQRVKGSSGLSRMTVTGQYDDNGNFVPDATQSGASVGSTGGEQLIQAGSVVINAATATVNSGATSTNQNGVVGNATNGTGSKMNNAPQADNGTGATFTTLHTENNRHDYTVKKDYAEGAFGGKVSGSGAAKALFGRNYNDILMQNGEYQGSESSLRGTYAHSDLEYAHRFNEVLQKTSLSDAEKAEIAKFNTAKDINEYLTQRGYIDTNGELTEAGTDAGLGKLNNDLQTSYLDEAKAFYSAREETMSKYQELLKGQGLSSEEIEAKSTAMSEEADIMAHKMGAATAAIPGKVIATELSTGNTYAGVDIGSTADFLKFDEATGTFTVGDYKTGAQHNGEANEQMSFTADTLRTLLSQYAASFGNSKDLDDSAFWDEHAQDLMDNGINFNGIRNAFRSLRDSGRLGVKEDGTADLSRVRFVNNVISTRGESGGDVYSQSLNPYSNATLNDDVAKVERGESLTAEERQQHENASVVGQKQYRYNENGQVTETTNAEPKPEFYGEENGSYRKISFEDDRSVDSNLLESANKLLSLRNKVMMGEELDEEDQIAKSQAEQRLGLARIQQGTEETATESVGNVLKAYDEAVGQGDKRVAIQQVFLQLKEQELRLETEIAAIRNNTATDEQTRAAAIDNRAKALEDVKDRYGKLYDSADADMQDWMGNIDAAYTNKISDAQSAAATDAEINSILGEEADVGNEKLFNQMFKSYKKTQSKINKNEIAMDAAARKSQDTTRKASERAGYDSTVKALSKENEILREQGILLEKNGEQWRLRNAMTGEATNLTAEQKKQVMAFQQESEAQKSTGLAKNATYIPKQQQGFLGSVFNEFQSSIAYLTKVSLIYGVIGKIKQAFTSMIQQTQQLDEAITKLEIVTNASRESLKSAVEDYNNIAQDMGVATDTVLAAANDWLRAGYDIQTANVLIQDSIKLSTLGMMDAEAATKSLISTMKGWKLSADDMAKVVDNVTALDTKFATTAGDIMTAMSRANVSAGMSGMSIEDFESYITTILDTSQLSAETVGTSMKTLIARFGNVKAGKFADSYDPNSENAEEYEALNDIETVLSKVGVATRNSVGDFRDMSDVLSDIATKWTTFDEVTQNAITTAMAGTRQRESLNVLFSNWDQVGKAQDVIRSSGGTADQKYDKYMDSLAAAQNEFKAVMQEQIIEASAIKKILEKVYSMGTDLIKNIKPILGIAATLAFLKYLPQISAGMFGQNNIFAGAANSLSGVRYGGQYIRDAISNHQGEVAYYKQQYGDNWRYARNMQNWQTQATQRFDDAVSKRSVDLSNQGVIHDRYGNLINMSDARSLSAAQNLLTSGEGFDLKQIQYLSNLNSFNRGAFFQNAATLAGTNGGQYLLGMKDANGQYRGFTNSESQYINENIGKLRDKTNPMALNDFVEGLLKASNALDGLSAEAEKAARANATEAAESMKAADSDAVEAAGSIRAQGNGLGGTIGEAIANGNLNKNGALIAGQIMDGVGVAAAGRSIPTIPDIPQKSPKTPKQLRGKAAGPSRQEYRNARREIKKMGGEKGYASAKDAQESLERDVDAPSKEVESKETSLNAARGEVADAESRLAEAKARAPQKRRGKGVKKAKRQISREQTNLSQAQIKARLRQEDYEANKSALDQTTSVKQGMDEFVRDYEKNQKIIDSYQSKHNFKDFAKTQFASLGEQLKGVRRTVSAGWDKLNAAVQGNAAQITSASMMGSMLTSGILDAKTGKSMSQRFVGSGMSEGAAGTISTIGQMAPLVGSVFGPWGALAGGVISVGTNIWSTIADSGKVTNDELIEMGKEASEKISKYVTQINDTMAKRDSLQSQSNRFSQLVKGVNSVGQNISLNTDEWNEYQSILKQLIDASDYLYASYDEQGNIIAQSTKGFVDLNEAMQSTIDEANKAIQIDAAVAASDYDAIKKDAAGKAVAILDGAIDSYFDNDFGLDFDDFYFSARNRMNGGKADAPSFGDYFLKVLQMVTELRFDSDSVKERGVFNANRIKQSVFQGTREALAQDKTEDQIIQMYQDMEMRHGYWGAKSLTADEYNTLYGNAVQAVKHQQAVEQKAELIYNQSLRENSALALHAVEGYEDLPNNVQSWMNLMVQSQTYDFFKRDKDGALITKGGEAVKVNEEQQGANATASPQYAQNLAKFAIANPGLINEIMSFDNNTADTAQWDAHRDTSAQLAGKASLQVAEGDDADLIFNSDDIDAETAAKRNSYYQQYINTLKAQGYTVNDNAIVTDFSEDNNILGIYDWSRGQFYSYSDLQSGAVNLSEFAKDERQIIADEIKRGDIKLGDEFNYEDYTLEELRSVKKYQAQLQGVGDKTEVLNRIFELSADGGVKASEAYNRLSQTLRSLGYDVSTTASTIKSFKEALDAGKLDENNFFVQTLNNIASGLQVNPNNELVDNVSWLIDNMSLLGDFDQFGRVSKSVSELSKDFVDIDKILLDINKDGTISMENLAKLLESFPELAQYIDDFDALKEALANLNQLKTEKLIGSIKTTLLDNNEYISTLLNSEAVGEDGKTNAKRLGLNSDDITNLLSYGNLNKLLDLFGQVYELNESGEYQKKEAYKGYSLVERDDKGKLDTSKSSWATVIGKSLFGLDSSDENFAQDLYKNLREVYSKRVGVTEGNMEEFGVNDASASNIATLMQRTGLDLTTPQALEPMLQAQLVALQSERDAVMAAAKTEEEQWAQTLQDAISKVNSAYERGTISAEDYIAQLKALSQYSQLTAEQQAELAEKIEDVNVAQLKTQFGKGQLSGEDYRSQLSQYIHQNAYGTEDYNSMVDDYLASFDTEVSYIQSKMDILESNDYAERNKLLNEQEAVLQNKLVALQAAKMQGSEEYLKIQSQIVKNLEEQYKNQVAIYDKKISELKAQQSLYAQNDYNGKIINSEKQLQVLRERNQYIAEQGEATKEEYLKALQEEYEMERQILDLKVQKDTNDMDAFGTIIQYQIDLYNKRKDAINEYYDNEISKLEDINDQRKRSIEYEEKLQALENAKKEKVRVYTAGVGWTYQQNQAAVEKAQNDLDDYKSLRHIEDLKFAQEKQNEMLDEMINDWADLKKVIDWQKESTDAENAIHTLIADGYLTNTENSEDIAGAVAEIHDMKDRDLVGNVIGAKGNLSTLLNSYSASKKALHIYDTDLDNAFANKTGYMQINTGNIATYTQNAKTSLANLEKYGIQLKEGTSIKVETNLDTYEPYHYDAKLDTINTSIGKVVAELTELKLELGGTPTKMEGKRIMTHTVTVDTSRPYIVDGEQYYRIIDGRFADNFVKAKTVAKGENQATVQWIYEGQYSSGIENGPVDFTGLAMLHGTPSNPEYVLNSKQAGQLLKNLATISISPYQAPKVDSYSSDTSSIINNFNFDKIVLPDVNDPEQFMTELVRQTKSQFSTIQKQYK